MTVRTYLVETSIKNNTELIGRKTFRLNASDKLMYGGDGTYSVSRKIQKLINKQENQKGIKYIVDSFYLQSLVDIDGYLETLDIYELKGELT